MEQATSRTGAGRSVVALLVGLGLVAVACASSGTDPERINDDEQVIELSGRVDLLSDTSPSGVEAGLVDATILVVSTEDEDDFWRGAGIDGGPETLATVILVVSERLRALATAALTTDDSGRFTAQVSPGRYLLCVAGIRSTLPLGEDDQRRLVVTGCARTRVLDSNTAVVLTYSPSSESTGISYE